MSKILSESDDSDDQQEYDSLMSATSSKSSMEKELLIQTSPTTVTGLSCRSILAIISFFGFVNVYCLRVNLSVAIVAMVNSTGIDDTKNASECPPPNGTVYTTSNGEFPWSQQLQGIILGSFFYGYICTNIVGGYLAQKYGGKWIFGLGVLATAVFSLFTPVAARSGSTALICLRVLEGLFEGVTFPAMHAMWALWAPKMERSKLVSFSYAGAHMGTIISLPLTGVLASSTFLRGWPSAFYVFGFLGCVWFVFWVFFAFDSPAKHPRISQEELLYIEKSVGITHPNHRVPWLSVFTSMPVWSIIVVHFCANWGFYTMLTSLPSYLSHILHFNLEQNGMLSAVPYIGLFCIMTSFGWIADYIRSHRYLSTKNTRKVLIAIGFLTPAALMVGIGFTGCNVPLALTLVIFSVATLGFSFPGYVVNHVDIAPMYAGTLMGITNTAGTIPGFLGPQIVGVLTNHNETRQQWQYVFIIAATINVFGALFYVVFGDGEQQSWAKDVKTKAGSRADQTHLAAD